MLYDTMNIEQHIDEWAPRNRFQRMDFDTTSKPVRLKLFSDIVLAINNQGEGLAQLSFETPTGQSIRFLRNAEVIHLQDVAHLVDFFAWLALVCTGLALVLLGCINFFKLKRPSAKLLLLFTAFPMVIGTIGTLLIGPTKVFYALHVWIFPADHEWFFIYPDSLMTTLMKAPDLFGYIALLWLGTALLLWGALLFVLFRKFKVSQ